MSYTLLNDGASHSFSTAGSGPFTVRKSGGGAATSLTISAGATVTGAAFAGVGTDVAHAPGVSSQSCNLTITGGTVTGGSETGYDGWPAAGILSVFDAVSISGGTVVGGTSDSTAYPALRLVSPASASIASVTATGGAATATDSEGGPGLSLDLANTTDALTIASGTWAGGNGNARGGDAVDAAVNGTLTVTNGTYSGGNGTAGSGAVGGNGATVKQTDAASVLAINGGHFSPGTGSLSSGYALRIETVGAASSSLNAVVSGRVALGLDTGAVFVVHGSGLAWTAGGGGGGTVTGTIGGIPASSFTVVDLTGASPGFTVTGGGGGSSVTFTGN